MRCPILVDDFSCGEKVVVGKHGYVVIIGLAYRVFSFMRVHKRALIAYLFPLASLFHWHHHIADISLSLEMVRMDGWACLLVPLHPNGYYSVSIGMYVFYERRVGLCMG